MKKTLSRILAALLAFITVALLLPFAALDIGAAETPTSLNDLGYLGAGVNLLRKVTGERDSLLSKSSLRPTSDIFKSFEDITYESDYIGNTYNTVNVYTSFMDYASSMGVDFGVKASAGYEGVIGSANVSASLQMGSGISFSESNSMKVTIAKTSTVKYAYGLGWRNYGVIGSVKALQKNLNDDFVKALTTSEPKDIFAFYGTHIITKYRLGGEYTYASYLVSTEASLSNTENIEASTSAGVDVYGVNAAVEASMKYKEEASRKAGSTNTNVYQKTIGGNTLSVGSNGATDAMINNWGDSLTEIDEKTGKVKADIITDGIELIAIWDLLPEGYESQKAALENYYLEQVAGINNSLLSTFVYKTVATETAPDYAGYNIITSPSEFDAIRDDMSAKYVLACDIDLSSYANWEPIGSESEPFRGTLDGNGNTVKGLTITDCGEKYIGLFGYNTGTVENLEVTGIINISGERDITYIGGVVGYNGGIVKNCRSGATVNGATEIDTIGETEKYTINYVLDSADNDIYGRCETKNADENPLEYARGEVVTVAEPTRSPLDIFEGWYTDADYGEIFDPEYYADHPEDVTLYAKWDVALYYNTITETPTHFTENSAKDRAVIDWSEYTGKNDFKNTVTIEGMTAVYFKGSKSASFNQIAIATASISKESPLAVYFDNFKTFGASRLDSVAPWDNNDYSVLEEGKILNIIAVGESSIDCSSAPSWQCAVGDYDIINISGDGSLALKANYIYAIESCGVVNVDGNVKLSLYGGSNGEYASVKLNELNINVTGDGYVYANNFCAKLDNTKFGGNGSIETQYSRYELISDAKNWADAEAYCKSLGGHLATITSQEENDVVGKLTSAICWLGGSGSINDGWEWCTGEAFRYSDWAPTEPNNTYGGEDRIEFRSNANGWNDNRHEHEHSFIVEYDKVPKLINAASSEDSVYLLFNKYYTWDEAEAYCESIGGHLVTITSQEEQDVVGKLASAAMYTAWIGASDTETEGKFKWVTGEKFEYSNWAPEEPISSDDYNWVLFGNANSYMNNKWGAVVSSRASSFICEIEREDAPILLSTTEKENGGRYELYAAPFTWKEAKAYCESLGGHLATITSAEEQEILNGIVENRQIRMWLGATDEITEWEWKWVTGEESGYTNWSPNEPSDHNYRAHYMKAFRTGMWDDTYNDAPVPGFLCEYDDGVEPNTLTEHAMFAGAIAGFNAGEINACYGGGSVTVTASTDATGMTAAACGIAGINEKTIYTSFSDAVVSAAATAASGEFGADAYAYHIALCSGDDAFIDAYSFGEAATAPSALAANIAKRDGASTAGDDTSAKTAALAKWAEDRLHISRVTKTEYIAGELFNAATITVTKDGGALAASEYSTRYNLLTPGTTNTTVVCGDEKKYIPMNIIPVVTESVEISALSGHPTSFAYGEEFTFKGLVLERIMSDGTIYNIAAMTKAKVNDVWVDTPNESVSVSTPDTQKLGKKTVEVEWIDSDTNKIYTMSYEITVGSATLSGIVTITGKNTYGNVLTASYSGNETVKYQWYADGAAIDGETLAGYTVDKEDTGKTVTVTVSGINNYSGSVTSEGVVIGKYTPEAPDAPVLRSLGDTEVVLAQADGVEFRCGLNGEWQTSNTFEGLSPNVRYSFYARIAETEYNTPSADSEALSVTTTETVDTISYDANGGTGAPEAQKKAAGSGIVLSETVPTRKGYTFLGWSADATAEAAEYSAGDSYDGDGDITLFAVWEKNAIGADDPQIIITSARAMKGDSVTVNFELANMPLAKTVMLEDFAYDKSRVELVSGEWKLSGAAMVDWDIEGESAIITFSENIDLNGVIFSAVFRVLDDAEDGAVAINCTSIVTQKAASGGETELEHSTVSGVLTVTSIPAGDVNGDGFVDSDDAIHLLRHSLRPAKYPINQDGNMNGDGFVDSDDAIYLLRHTLMPGKYPLRNKY